MRQLLGSGSPAGTTGKWVFTASGGKRVFPARVSAVGVGWTGGDVIIEELIAGLPGQANSPYGQSADTGTVEELGRIGFGGGDLLIDKPVEYLRARTDTAANGFAGTVFVGIEMLE
jgi:hypothetical protein